MDIKNICELSLVNGVVHAHYALDVYIDLETAERIVFERKKLTNYKPHPVIVTGGPIRTSPEARRYAFTTESSELITSWAIVTDDSLIKTTFYKLLFFTQNRKRKMRFFNTKEEALSWISNRQKSEFTEPFLS